MTSVHFYSIECFRGPMIDEVGVTESLALQRSLVVTSPTRIKPWESRTMMVVPFQSCDAFPRHLDRTKF
jgi:hypothetical protein